MQLSFPYLSVSGGEMSVIGRDTPVPPDDDEDPPVEEPPEHRHDDDAPVREPERDEPVRSNS